MAELASTAGGDWAAPVAPRPRRDSQRSDAVWHLYERRYADMVRFAAFLTGDVHAAQDIAHEAFVRLLDAWDRIADPERADAYLKATIVNLVRGEHRRRERGRTSAAHHTSRSWPPPRTTRSAASVASTCSTPCRHYRSASGRAW